MMTKTLQTISKDWAKLANVLAMPRSEIDYQQRLTLLNELLDESLYGNLQSIIYNLLNLLNFISFY